MIRSPSTPRFLATVCSLAAFSPLTTVVVQTCDAVETHEVTPEAPWNKHCRESMANYIVRERKDDEQEFKRIPHAVMQHHNPANNDRGLIYLWTQENGVPVVIISAVLQSFKKDSLKELRDCTPPL